MLPHAYPAVNASGNSCLHRECLAVNLLALQQSLMAAGTFFVILVCTPILSGLARVVCVDFAPGRVGDQNVMLK